MISIKTSQLVCLLLCRIQISDHVFWLSGWGLSWKGLLWVVAINILTALVEVIIKVNSDDDFCSQISDLKWHWFMTVLRDSFSKTNGVLYVQELYFFKNKKPVFTFTFTVNVSFIVKQGSDNLMFFAYRALS